MQSASGTPNAASARKTPRRTRLDWTAMAQSPTFKAFSTGEGST
jgi:hypothetical protein